MLNTCSIATIILDSSHHYCVFTEHVIVSDAFIGFASPASVFLALRCKVMLFYGLAFLCFDLELHSKYCASVVNFTVPYAFKEEACGKFLFYYGRIDYLLMAYRNLTGG